MSNSLNSPEAAELTDFEAARLAHQIAAERFLPIQARHFEAHLATAARNASFGKVPTYDRTGLDPVWLTLLDEAVREVETFRNPGLMRRIQERARVGLAGRFGFEDEPA